jgi:hypothetical protein
MTAQEQRELGKLSGKMELVLQSLTSLHDKVEGFSARCDICKRDLTEQSKKEASAAAQDAVKTVKIIAATILIISLVAVSGYLFKNHFVPDVVNKSSIEENK